MGITTPLVLSQPASAHFLVEDTSTGLRASFHVSPDHDPIAGEESIISFDFANASSETKDYSYVLTVKPTQGDAATVPVDIPGNVVIGRYVFPSQGFYEIMLTATSKTDGTTSELQYGQRVSRGTTSEDGRPFGPVEIAAIVGTVSLATAAIMFSLVSDNKRKVKENDTKDRT